MTMNVSTHNTINEVFLKVAGAYAECISMEQGHSEGIQNAFGRNVEVQSADLSRLLGYAATGIRCAALMDAEVLHDQRNRLASFGRLHVPITVVATGEALRYLSSFASSGAIVLLARQAQELADLLLIGQVISEKSLVPVVILVEDIEQEVGNVLLPDPKQMYEWMGDPDGRVPDPSPAQQMIFGALRRRMPGWMHMDVPSFVGARKVGVDAGLEKASQEVFDRRDIQRIIDTTLDAFMLQMGRNWKTEEVVGSEKMRSVLVLPQPYPVIMQALTNDPTLRKEKVTVIGMRQLHPVVLPAGSNGKSLDRIALLESVQLDGVQDWLFRGWSVLAELDGVKRQHGIYIQTPGIKAILAAVHNLVSRSNGKRSYWLNVPFTRATAPIPRYELMLQEISRQYTGIQELMLGDTEIESEEIPLDPIPESVRTFANAGPPFARPARFHDSVVMRGDNVSSSNVADPFQSIPVMPVGTAAFQRPNGVSEHPSFSPKSCTGCLACLTACPHAALPMKAVTMDAVIKLGMDRAKANGTIIRALTPVMRTWSKIANERAATLIGKVSKPEQILATAFDETLKTIKEDEKVEMLKEEYAAVMNSIVALPLAVTDELFASQHKIKAGTGLLLTASLDASACTGCGFCVTACDDDALAMGPLETEVPDRVRLFEQLSETTDLSIEDLCRSTSLDPISINLLHTARYRSVVGAAEGDSHAAVKSTLRLVFAALEQERAPLLGEIDEAIGKHVTAIRSNVKKQLSDALPVKRLDSLMDVLSQHSEERMSMDRIFDEWGREESFKTTDKRSLERQLSLIDALNELRWASNEGVLKNGRSRYLVVMDEGLSGLAQHPWNHFTAPVMYAGTNDIAALALGVAEGHMRHVLDNIRLMRRAALEAAGKYNPVDHDRSIAGLVWEDLTEEEKNWMPTMLIVGREDLLTGAGASVHALMQRGIPVKLIAIDGGKVATDGANATLAAQANALWPFMVSGKSTIARTSAGDLVEMHKALKAAFRSPLGAILSIFAPDASQLDILPDRWAAAAELAISSRAMVPFLFTPDSKKSFAGKMEVLRSVVTDDWNHTTLSFDQSDKEQTLDYEITWADWAFLMKGWVNEFKHAEEAEGQVSVAEYLRLDEDEREGKTPIILRIDEHSALRRYNVSSKVVEACTEVLSNLRTLREWSGLFTDQPERLKEQVMQELAVRFEKEKNALESTLNDEKQNWESEHLTALKQQIKERLMQLSGN